MDKDNNVNVDKIREALKYVNDRVMLDQERLSPLITMLREALTLTPQPKLYKNQPVLVDDERGAGWVKALFTGYQSDGEYPFLASKLNGIHEEEGWTHCKPDALAESAINWIEHDPEVRDSINMEKDDKSQVIVAVYEDEEDEDAFFLAGGKQGGLYLEGVIRYAIIPLPKWLEHKNA